MKIFSTNLKHFRRNDKYVIVKFWIKCSICAAMVKGTAQITDEELLKQIACGIKQMRVSRGITQEVFYNDTNIHIGRIERGKTNISVSTLKAICNYFSVKPSEFFSSISL